MSRIRERDRYYYTRDHLGSVREMTDSSGTIQARYDYDPYGRTTLVSGSNLSDFQYAGYYTHQPSGLNLTKYRAYDPNTARWLSRDPMGEGSDATLYSYVYNDPINEVDPLGLYGTKTGGQRIADVANAAQAAAAALAAEQASHLAPPTPVPPTPPFSPGAFTFDLVDSFSVQNSIANPLRTAAEYGIGYPAKITAIKAMQGSSCSMVKAAGEGLGHAALPLFLGLTLGATIYDAATAPAAPPAPPAPWVPDSQNRGGQLHNNGYDN